MSWYLRADDALYRADSNVYGPGWVLSGETPTDEPVHGWTWYATDDEALLATGLAVAITERLDRFDPPLSPMQAQVKERLTTDTTADLTKLEQAITDLALLLGDNTTAGSIRSWKAPIANNATLTGAQGKALADLLISETQSTRRIARQVLRLAKAMVGDFSSSEVGSDM